MWTGLEPALQMLADVSPRRTTSSLAMLHRLINRHAVPTLEDICSNLESCCDAELKTIDVMCEGKTRLLQQDRAAVEARMEEWTCVAERMTALLDRRVGEDNARLTSDTSIGARGDAEDDDVLPRMKRQRFSEPLEHFSDEASQACMEGLAALAPTWRLLCGHAGAPWLSVETLNL